MIIQPVLQYGPSTAGGGEYWAVANWYVTSSLQAYYTPLTRVNVGDHIKGAMYEDSGTYFSEAWVNGQKLKALNMSQLPTLNDAQVTMEVYNVDGCNEYPVGGSIDFFDMSLTEAPATNVTIKWQIQTVGTDCHIGASCSGPTNCTITY